jgi:hypothetical protein
MLHAAIGLMFVLLLAPQERDQAKPAAVTLRQLRKLSHEWLARDVAEKTLAENRAYAHLIIAFGLARAGDGDEAKKLLTEVAVILEKSDAAHQCLLGLYRHRIEQALAKKPPVGPLPVKLLVSVTPTGNEGGNAPIKMHHYIVLRAREMSRIIEPHEQIDPYLPWTSKGDDPLVARLGPLQDEADPERFTRDAQKLLKDAASASAETRLRITTRLAALGPRAGEPFCIEVLKIVPELIRIARKDNSDSLRREGVALVEQSLTLAAVLKKPELFKPLVTETVDLMKMQEGETTTATIARLTTRCEQGFRVMGLKDEAGAFLKDTAGKLPDATDAESLLKVAGKSWADAARTRLAEAGIRHVASQEAEATKLLTLVRDVVLDPPATDRGFAYYRLVSEYGAACGRLAPAEAKKRLEELFTKLPKVPDTYTTATHYSRYHLLILEAVVLSLVEASDPGR